MASRFGPLTRVRKFENFQKILSFQSLGPKVPNLAHGWEGIPQGKNLGDYACCQMTATYRYAYGTITLFFDTYRYVWTVRVFLLRDAMLGDMRCRRVSLLLSQATTACTKTAINIGSRKQRRAVALGVQRSPWGDPISEFADIFGVRKLKSLIPVRDFSFLMPKISANSDVGGALNGSAEYMCGRLKSMIFDSISHYISATVQDRDIVTTEG